MNDAFPPATDAALASAPDPFARAVCHGCGAALLPSGRFCEACGRDQAADAADFDVEIAALHAPQIAKARKWIAITGGLYVLGGLLLFAVRRTGGDTFCCGTIPRLVGLYLQLG